MGEIRALSQDECCHLLRVVGTNSSPFRRVRDRAMIFTFPLTGARLREIVQLDRADVDLHQSTIRLHRKGGEIKCSAAGRHGKDRDQGLPKTQAQEEPGKSAFHFLPESKNRAWHSLVFSEEIFQENPDKRKRNGTSRFTAHICDLAFKPGRKSQSHSGLMNHKSLATTARYLHSRSQELVKAVNGLKLLGG
jgi:integrase